MQVATSTREPVQFWAPWHLNDDGSAKPGAPSFLIRVADVIERGLFEAELAGRYNAAAVWPFELKAAAERGLRALLANAPEHLDRALELCAAEYKGELAGAARETWSSLEATLRQVDGEYATLAGQAAARAELIPTIAAARFVCGWENVVGMNGAPVEFKLGPDGRVDRDALAAVEGVLLQVVGREAYRLQYLRSRDPLSPRSRSDAARGTSTSGAKTLGARRGNSRGSSSRKTRG